MKVENVKLSVYPMSDSDYVRLGFYVTEDMARTLGYAHSGLAFSVVCRDEFLALISLGFKPFSKACMEIDIGNDMTFIIYEATFTGGVGEWTSKAQTKYGY